MKQFIKRKMKRSIKKIFKISRSPYPVSSWYDRVSLKWGFFLMVVVFVFALYQNTNPTETASLAQKPSGDIKCVDGDTFWYGDEKIRLLAIDTPESTTVVEAYGIEASKRTCELLTSATSITLYYDEGNEIDKYDRKLYWVYIDGEFLQEMLVSEGLAEIKYVDNNTVDQSRLKTLENAQSAAQANELKIWSDE